MENSPKKAGLGLVAGVVFLPWIFSWLTLRRGYSRTLRLTAFAWGLAALALVVITPAKPRPPSIETAKTAAAAPPAVVATPTPSPVEPGQGAPSEKLPGDISSRTWKGPWPFTTDEATVGCAGIGGTLSNGTRLWLLYVDVADKRYALNGTAKGRASALGWEADLKPVWKTAADGGGTRIPLSEVIALGQRICEGTYK